ncbi:STAS/SEC14 domain-containing protein [Hymenobacter cellulosilyticus]|uniref:STAS/SEC14 domain-containing protein n=1 Tax=Hymenobacter cellulosilyticus TaxID=2932248 RepID=A0A8T9Q3H5_9BACT|nr:STAS/SEC14 domain-containing protein [Hymenobacter cellulosilyticus]UOQ72286.1 STAS/SEC14 domain-containing protein [Hymenobacter cellulosilyticus]
MSLPSSVSSIYFRNALCSISYDSQGFILLVWANVVCQDQELHSIYEHTLQALRHHGTGKLLTDHRLRQPLPLSAQQWIAQEWIPRAMREAGYSHCAILENQTPLGRLAARAVGDALSLPLDFRYFSTLEEARAWLSKA